MENNTEIGCAGILGSTKTESGSTRRFAFVVNPIACSGKCKAYFEIAKAVFDKRKTEYTVFYTEYHGHAEQLALSAAAGFDVVVAVGGDGTVREVASALNVSKSTLGILPFGTGNDFAGVLQIPTQPEAAAKLLLDGEAKLTDLGFANGRIFANVCGVGFDVDVLERTEKHKKGRKGMLPYMLGIVDAVLHKKKIHAFVSLDGGEETALDALMIDVCNGRRFGGGMLVAPKAELDDGLFDVCIAKYLGFFRIITLLPSFIKGKHINNKAVTYTRAKTVRIRTDEECTVQLDGELIERAPLECRISAGAIRLIRP